MRLLVSLVLALIVLLLVAFCALPALDPAKRDDQRMATLIAHERARMKLEREQADAARLAPIRVFAVAVWLLVWPCTALGGIFIGIDWYRRTRRLVKPDVAGRWPIARAVLETDPRPSLAALALAQQTRQVLALATPQPVPHHLTYSPKFDARPVSSTGKFYKGEADAPLAQADTDTAWEAPSFRDLLNQGMIAQGAPLILGFTSEGPLRGDWKDVYSSAVAGISGMGKTTTIRFLACQSALHGANFVVIDPHANVQDESLAATLAPLRNRYLCAEATDDGPILDAIGLVASKLDARLKGDANRQPLLVLVDEFTRLMRNPAVANDLGDLIEAIGQEGRKVGVFALLSGQIWTADRSGGTRARDSLASAYVHRIKRSQARHLISADEARLVENLAPGRAVLFRTNGDYETVAIPQTTGFDVAHVASLLAPLPQSEINRREIDLEVVSTASQSHEPLPADAVRIIELFRTGHDVAAIIRDLYPDAKNGQPFQKRSSEVQAVLRSAL